MLSASQSLTTADFTFNLKKGKYALQLIGKNELCLNYANCYTFIDIMTLSTWGIHVTIEVGETELTNTI